MNRSKKYNPRAIQPKKSDRKAAAGKSRFVVPLDAIGMKDRAVFGGKNSSLGEMIQHMRELEIAVPDGFATTADAYRLFVRENKLGPLIREHLGHWRSRRESLEQCGKAIRSAVNSGAIPDDVAREVLDHWAMLQRKSGRPMDIEWAKDGLSKELFIVQARPETVQSRKTASALKTYSLKHKGKTILSGLAVLVAQMTDPDWGPIMKRASAIITAHGGRTSHAAIVSRELGLPAIVGASSAMRLLKDGMEVTVSCAEGDEGVVYAGRLPFRESDLTSDKIRETRTKVMLNMGDPAAALRWWRLHADGIGLARMEFIIANHMKIHPMALAHFERVKDIATRKHISALTKGYAGKPDYFVDRLAEGVARLAASQYPRPMIVRMSDFKTNEYAKLIGGKEFEPVEPNPMIGWRGASRYYSDGYRDGFALECRSIRKLRDQIGLNNVVVMIPFCRTTEEADLVFREMARHGLRRGVRGLEVYVMSEIPSNVILADQFAARFDGFSIGSNDLTQLALGVDRDSGALKHLFDEENPAVKDLIRDVIAAAHRNSVHVGLCGQAPSDHPAFARFLVKAGIDAISVTPDGFIAVKNNIAAAEAGGVPSLAALF